MTTPNMARGHASGSCGSTISARASTSASWSVIPSGTPCRTGTGSRPLNWLLATNQTSCPAAAAALASGTIGRTCPKAGMAAKQILIL